jgi:hypothetical protein
VRAAAVIATCALGMATLVPADAGAGATVVAGGDRASILPPAGAAVASYENSGYRLRVVDSVAEVEVDLAPIASTAPFESAKAGPDAPEATLARALTAGSRSVHQAVSAVLGWVAGNVRYELDREAPQDARSVLARRSAYCTGFARVSVVLLGAVGIEAREVAGYVVGDMPGVDRSGFHRWIEVRYPDRGWVFSDPLASHGFVPATYLRLASEHLASASPGQALLLRRSDGIIPIDTRPGAAAAVRVRANDDIRLAIALDSGRDGEAVLEGAGFRRTLALLGGRGTFVGLEPGSYRLQVSDGGRVAAWKDVTFRDRVFAEMRIPAPPAGGATGGTMR